MKYESISYEITPAQSNTLKEEELDEWLVGANSAHAKNDSLSEGNKGIKVLRTHYFHGSSIIVTFSIMIKALKVKVLPTKPDKIYDYLLKKQCCIA